MLTLKDQYEELRAHLKGIPARAKAAGRDTLTAAELAEVEAGMQRAAGMQQQIKAADESAARLAQITGLPEFAAAGEALTALGARGVPGGAGGGGWKSVAEQLSSEGKATCGTKELIISEPSGATTQVATGFTDLPYDARFLYPLIPQIPTSGELAVTDFRVTARAADEGSTAIERDPLSAADKATHDLTVSGFTEPVKQVAIILDAIPQAIIEAVPSLLQLLQSEAQVVLNQAVEAHVRAAITAAAPPSGVVAGSTEARVREGISKMQLLGITPNVVVLNPTDSEGVDTHTMIDTITRYPFGLRQVTSTAAAAGAPLLLDTGRIGVLYLGGATFLLDPFAGVSGKNFAQNLVDMRSEHDVLMVVRNVNAAYVCSAGS